MQAPPPRSFMKIFPGPHGKATGEKMRPGQSRPRNGRRASQALFASVEVRRGPFPAIFPERAVEMGGQGASQASGAKGAFFMRRPGRIFSPVAFP